MRSRPRMSAPGDSDQRRASWAWTAGEDEMAESITPSPRLRGASARSCPRHDLNDAGRRSPDAGRGEGQLRAAALVATPLPDPLPSRGEGDGSSRLLHAEIVDQLRQLC